VVNDPGTNKARLLVQTYPRSQELTSYVSGSPWKASPDTRMTELLHGTGVRLGLVTNGEHWMLVDAPKGETTGYASWYASLWLEEYITLRAFRSLLSASRFFNVPDDQTLEALLAKSASNQQEVTDQLGYQVRRAVEVLIHSLDRADQDFGRELLADVSPEQLYESALTVMMRLVFLFCAEERELIPSKPFPVYEQNYSVSTISKQLRELADQHGEELLERRYDAWPRLLAAFRAVYGGLKHDDVHIPAYGGNLFNPDRFPFLEGRNWNTTWRVAGGGNRTKEETVAAKHYRELEVWQLAMDLATECYQVTKLFPKEELFGMTSQIRRAAASIPANIAEGQGRESTKEFLNFLSISWGSLMELETHLLLCQRVGLLT
jgi:four helix bundle protein